MPSLELKDVLCWMHTEQQPQDYDIAGVIRDQFLSACVGVSDANLQERICFDACHEIFKHHDWQRSFQRPQVIFISDIAPSCYLTALQWYLSTQCLDIRQIHVVIPSHLNSKSWWRDWCHQARIVGYNLHDWTPGENFYMREWNPHGNVMNWQHVWQRKLQGCQKTFSLFGGSYSGLDRCYLTLAFSDEHFRSHGMIDFHGVFAAREAVIGYCESLTNFIGADHVGEIAATYDTMIQNGHYQCTFDKSTFQYEYDLGVGLEPCQAWEINQRCWFNVVRETKDDHCFAMITEKSLRAFTHFCIPLPMGYESADGLRQLGFQLYDDIVDYGYQYGRGLKERVQGAKHQLQKYLGQDMTSYFLDRQQTFMHNAELAWDLAHGNLVQKLQLI